MVINVSPGAAYEGQIGQSAYAATKAGNHRHEHARSTRTGFDRGACQRDRPGSFMTAMVASLDEKAERAERADGSRSVWATARVCALLHLHHRKRLRQWRTVRLMPRRACGRSKSGWSLCVSNPALLEITNEIGRLFRRCSYASSRQPRLCRWRNPHHVRRGPDIRACGGERVDCSARPALACTWRSMHPMTIG